MTPTPTKVNRAGYDRPYDWAEERTTLFGVWWQPYRDQDGETVDPTEGENA